MQYLLYCSFTFLSSPTQVYWQPNTCQTAGNRQQALYLKLIMNSCWKMFDKSMAFMIQNTKRAVSFFLWEHRFCCRDYAWKPFEMNVHFASSPHQDVSLAAKILLRPCHRKHRKAEHSIKHQWYLPAPLQPLLIQPAHTQTKAYLPCLLEGFLKARWSIINTNLI